MTEHFTQAEAVAFAHTYLPKPHTVRELTAVLNAAAEKGRAALLEELGKVEPIGYLCDWGNDGYGLTRQTVYYGEPGSATQDDWNEYPKIYENLPLYTRPLPAQDVNEHKPNCKECAKWVQEQADNREWQDGVKRGNELVAALAAAKCGGLA